MPEPTVSISTSASGGSLSAAASAKVAAVGPFYTINSPLPRAHFA